MSKWNPIEHRLFSFISGNCAGTPLRTWELFLAAIRGTTTMAGLTVEAVLHSDRYRTGMTVTNALMRTLNLEPHAICPAWSYTLRPRRLACRPATVAASSNSNSASRRAQKQSYTPARNCRSVLNVAGSIMPDPTGQNRPASRNRAYLLCGVKSQAKRV